MKARDSSIAVRVRRSVQPRIASFAPIARHDARILILGSMPGAASLQAGQYYAHPRNAFWPIMCGVLGLEVDAPYVARINAMQARSIALWDVLHSCRRNGSLDSAIEPDSVAANDFKAFFSRHPRIDRVCFNGAMAERCYRQQVLPDLRHASLEYIRLPSTSPAHASLSFSGKAALWNSALNLQTA